MILLEIHCIYGDFCEPMSLSLKNESKVQIAWIFPVSRQLIWKQNLKRFII